MITETIEWHPIILSLEVALASLVAVFILGIACAHFISRREFSGKYVLDALFTLPLVLPPVVTGFFLLLLVGKQGPIGMLLTRYFSTQIIFTPVAAVIASTVVAFPLMYQSSKAAFQSIDANLEAAARTLGASETRVFFTITLPLAWSGLAAGAVLSFARSMGEFGATIMIAGNIPGQTQTLPLAIYFAAESNDLITAGIYVTIICLITFSAILGLSKWSQTVGGNSRKEFSGAKSFY